MREELQAINEEYLDSELLENLENEIVLKYSLPDEVSKWKSRSLQLEQSITRLSTAMKNLYKVSKRDPETKMLDVEIHWNF